jgi:DNA-directed RNA polymerase specialized sigma24 family protein
MKKYRDDVCRLGKCVNIEVCKGLCPPISWLNGKGKSKEVLLSNLTNKENLEYINYNDTLSELSNDREIKEQRRIERLEKILTEPNDRGKFIKLALLAGFKQADIAQYFKISKQGISIIIKRASHKPAL